MATNPLEKRYFSGERFSWQMVYCFTTNTRAAISAVRAVTT